MTEIHGPTGLPLLRQSPTDPEFVQNPYRVYAAARARGDLVFWEDYGMVAAMSHAAVQALLRDRRMGREKPAEAAASPRPHLASFDLLEANSMLELEPPRHTRLRRLVLSAFTSRAIDGLAPGIERLCHELIDAFPGEAFDLLPAYATQVPVITIARLLGVPEEMAPQLLRWSNAMVAMYQARRTQRTERDAEAASAAFIAYMRDHLAEKRRAPGDDLITRLLAAQDAEGGLTPDETVATAILLLNAGHEATVHATGNGVAAILRHGGARQVVADPELAPALAEEILRHDPPLHIFTRHVYEEFTAFGHSFRRGDEVALVLGAAGRDPAVYPDPDRFDPARFIAKTPAHAAFGGGLHFCVGAPLARMEMAIALRVLFTRLPDLSLAAPPDFADLYHFHGLTRLMVRA